MTGQDPDVGRLGLLGKTITTTCAIRVVVLAPGTERVFDEREWRDALVEIDRGQVELELQDGDRHRLESGDVLWLVGLPIVALHNPGSDCAVLVAASRRHRHQPPAVDSPDPLTGEPHIGTVRDLQDGDLDPPILLRRSTTSSG